MNCSKVVRGILKKEWKLNLSRIVLDRRPLVRNLTARRALFYVPGDDKTKLLKALRCKVDCVVMDCADNVAHHQKEVARQTIRKFLDEGPDEKSKAEWIVRVNPVLDRHFCELDLDVLLSARNLPAGICLPKIIHVDNLHWFSEKVKNLLIKREISDRGPINFIMYVDTPVAVMNLSELCGKAMELSKTYPIELVALILGNNLVSSLGVTKTSSNLEVLYARQKLVLVAKAFGLQAIDLVNTNYKNEVQMENECKEGVKLGFTGKQVIHPNQITITQESFSPSRIKIKWAKAILEAFNERQQISKDDFTLDDATIDMPSIRQAQNIMETAKVAGKTKEI